MIGNLRAGGTFNLRGRCQLSLCIKTELQSNRRRRVISQMIPTRRDSAHQTLFDLDMSSDALVVVVVAPDDDASSDLAASMYGGSLMYNTVPKTMAAKTSRNLSCQDIRPSLN